MGASIWQRFGVTMGTAIVAAVLFSSLQVQASLIGNDVSATLILTELNPSPIEDTTDTVIDNVTATVSDTVVEFDKVTGTVFDELEWTLNLLGEGFILFGECTTFLGELCFDSGSANVSLSLTDLTWDPIPGRLVGVSITQALEVDQYGSSRDFVSEISPVVTDSSMTIEFALLGLFSLGDSVTVTGEFLTRHGVPEPSILALMGIGFLSLPLLRRRQTKPE